MSTSACGATASWKHSCTCTCQHTVAQGLMASIKTHIRAFAQRLSICLLLGDLRLSYQLQAQLDPCLVQSS